MNFTTRRAERAPFVGEATPLLRHLAGEFAPRVAALWPAPHAAFLTAPAARRHLVFMVLASDPDIADRTPNGLLELALSRAISAYLPDAPEGLRRALDHMGETAWPARDYLQLLKLLARPQASKLLRHAERIDADQVRAIATLPEAFLDTRVAALGLSSAQAELVAEVYALFVRQQGQAGADQAVARWATSATAKELFPRLLDGLWPEFAPPPFPGTWKLKPLTDYAALSDAAKRYRNCLRQYGQQAITGAGAYYEWLGDPGAIVSIWRDPLYGWRLNEAKLADNVTIPSPLREEIVGELRAMGVHVGRSVWQLEHALEQASEERFSLIPVKAVVADLFDD